MADASEVKPIATNDRRKRILIYAGAAVVIFLVGFVPMWWAASSRANERDEARRELRLCKIQSELASAAIDARLGEYELARQSASNFYTELRAELDKGSESVLDQSQHENLKSLLLTRDEVITLLARNDPAAAERLANAFASYRKAGVSSAGQR